MASLVMSTRWYQVLICSLLLFVVCCLLFVVFGWIRILRAAAGSCLPAGRTTVLYTTGTVAEAAIPNKLHSRLVSASLKGSVGYTSREASNRFSVLPPDNTSAISG